MVALPPRGDPTILAANAALEAKVEPPRPYLGLSGLGDPCARKVWLRFRWAVHEKWTAATLKMFEDGHVTETIWIERLRNTPHIEVWDRNPETGHQWSVTACNGHAKGHVDGIVRGLYQAPKTAHVLEVKASEKGPAKLAKLKTEHGEKAALLAWNQTYYVQAEMYMGLQQLTRHYLICSLPGGRGDPTTVRTDFDAKAFAHWSAVAQKIVDAKEPPERIGPATYWLCRGCGFWDLCHSRTQLPDRHCRTCLHATPVEDGNWHCARYDTLLTVEQQRVGCDSHRHIPGLMPWPQIDVCGEDVVYLKIDGAEFVDDGLSA